jgi:hypothetical protein
MRRRFVDNSEIQAIMRICTCAGWSADLVDPSSDLTAGVLVGDLFTDEKPTRRLNAAILSAKARGTPARVRDVCKALNLHNLKQLKILFPDVLADKSWAGRVTAGGQS